MRFLVINGGYGCQSSSFPFHDIFVPKPKAKGWFLVTSNRANLYVMTTTNFRPCININFRPCKFQTLWNPCITSWTNIMCETKVQTWVSEPWPQLTVKKRWAARYIGYHVYENHFSVLFKYCLCFAFLPGDPWNCSNSLRHQLGPWE